MKTAHEVLVAARELIAEERNWIKGDYDRKVDGRTCYCADGALMAAGTRWSVKYNTARVALANALGDYRHGVLNYNDEPSTTHADVLAMFDRAIAATALDDIHTEEGES